LNTINDERKKHIGLKYFTRLKILADKDEDKLLMAQTFDLFRNWVRIRKSYKHASEFCQKLVKSNKIQIAFSKLKRQTLFKPKRLEVLKP